MKLRDIQNKEMFCKNKSLAYASERLQGIIEVLNKQELPEEIIVQLNREIDTLNSFEDPEKRMLIRIKTTENNILELVRRRLGIITEKYYTFLWMSLGLAAFGLPLGTLIFAIKENPAFIATGLPLGSVLGIFIGIALDYRAKKENKVLVIKTSNGKSGVPY